MLNAIPKYLRNIESQVEVKLKLLKKPRSEILETKQMFLDEVLEIYQEAFKNLVEGTITHSSLLEKIKKSYEDSLNIRDERITQFINQDISRHVSLTADGDPLWSSRFLQTNPENVVQTHLDFIRAGADVISTNTYQASVDGFIKHLGVTATQGLDLIKKAVELAKQARNIYKEECERKSLLPRNILIAGSVGPFGAHLLDGSEYTGSYTDNTLEDTMREWHKPRIDTLANSGVDLLALETIPSEKEAKMLVHMIKDYDPLQAWITFSCKDDKSLAHGEDFQSVARKCWNINPNQLMGVGINCCSPKVVTNLIKGISAGIEPPIRLVTYPNSGEKYKSETGWVDEDNCESLDTFVHDWLELNVKFVGGCCRTYAEDIARIRNKVDSWTQK